MASWLLERFPLLPPLYRSHSFSPPSLTLPFCHVCRRTYRVAAGFLFSGNVLDDWKATWSDLRDTTCRRFIISFPLLKKNLLVSSAWFSSWGAGWSTSVKQDCSRSFGVTGPFTVPFLTASTGGVFLRVLVFLKWRNADWGHTERSRANASKRSAREAQAGWEVEGWVGWTVLARLWFEKFCQDFGDESGFCS